MNVVELLQALPDPYLQRAIRNLCSCAPRGEPAVSGDYFVATMLEDDMGAALIGGNLDAVS